MRGCLFALIATALFLGCAEPPEACNLDEARLLRQSGVYSQAALLYEDAIAAGDSSPAILLEFAETALLAAQTERSPVFRRKAREAISLLAEYPGDAAPRTIGEFWRRLGWEMAGHNDSLQAFLCFDMALEYDLSDVFEEEWLFRGVFAGGNLVSVAEIPGELLDTPAADSLLAIAAEGFIVELDRIPLSRTDLRNSILQAKALLLLHTERPMEELNVLTELDRLGTINHGARQRRIQLLIETAEMDNAQGRTTSAREKLLEAWNTDFAAERIEAAYMLGLMAEGAGNPQTALQWYRRAVRVSPGFSSEAALLAAAKRDSLMFGLE